MCMTACLCLKNNQLISHFGHDYSNNKYSIQDLPLTSDPMDLEDHNFIWKNAQSCNCLHQTSHVYHWPNFKSAAEVVKLDV